MSFGWSVGDLIATIGILIKVSNALRDSDGAVAIYREDNLFIESLAATLEKICQGLEDGSLPVEMKTQVNIIRDPIMKMQKKLDAKFQTTLAEGGASNFARLLRSLPKKVEYGIFVSKQVEQLRAQIATPLQDIQLRLGLQLFSQVSGLVTGMRSLSLSMDKIESTIQTILKSHSARFNTAQTSQQHEILKWLK
jgi:hypothetical protein